MSPFGAQLLQVTLELIVNRRSHSCIPLNIKGEPGQCRVVGVGKVVSLACDAKIERPSTAANERCRTAVSGGDEPSMTSFGARSFGAKLVQWCGEHESINDGAIDDGAINDVAVQE